MNNLNRQIEIVCKQKLKQGGDWNKLLEAEARRLYSLIRIGISSYYRSYNPTKYKYTGNLLKSVSIRIVGDKFEIYFEPSLAYHPSIMPKKYQQAFVPTLIDYGWDWGRTPRINHFTYYEGYHFIEDAIAEFRRTTTLPITIQIESKYHPEYYNSLA